MRSSMRLREDSAVSILLADVDRFKLINDTHGHLIGDSVLRQMGRLLQAPLRVYDAVGRYGGEEFLVVLPGCTPQDAFDVAERVRSHICSRRVPTAAGALSITVSVGIASAAGDALQVDDLICAADTALYQAKHGGRNRVAVPLLSPREGCRPPYEQESVATLAPTEFLASPIL